MGYTTDFEGEFELNKPLTTEHREYLLAFSNTRRMKRDAAKTELREDPKRVAVGLPVGEDGGYFVNEGGLAGQDIGADVTDPNNPPRGQPSLWNHWGPSADGLSIEWDGGEKFYEYTAWLKYIIVHFLAPWGYVLNGEVEWHGEESSDFGKLVVKNNVLKKLRGVKTYEEEELES